MSLEVFGNYRSTCTQRVLTTLNFHGVKDYKFNTLEFAKGDHKKPEYLKLQPFGQLPAIKHGDFVLFESRPIARYLDSVFSSKTGKHLIPSDPQQRALTEQWLSVDHDNIQPVVKAVVAQKYNWYGPNVDEEVVKANFTKVGAVLDILEAHLAAKKTDFVVGNEFSIVEISLLPYFYLYNALGGEFAEQFQSRPHVAAWWKRTAGHPAWIASLALAK